jgi:hypothetical protein
MPWINHRPADELGKNPSELINFSLSISQLWESYLFVIYITIIKIKGAFDDDLKNKRTKYSAKKAYFKR